MKYFSINRKYGAIEVFLDVSKEGFAKSCESGYKH